MNMQSDALQKMFSYREYFTGWFLSLTTNMKMKSVTNFLKSKIHRVMIKQQAEV